MSYRINNFKNSVHGFFLSAAVSIAEPATILPLIIHHFSSSVVLVGLFASLLRGGAITVQLFAAFYAQSYSKVLPYLRIVFLFRLLSWFFIGLSIYLIGDTRPVMTLWLIGTGLFVFSFSAGFGGIYFKEIMAKVFSSSERGRTMANRQIFSSLGAIVSGGVAGYVLQNFQAPQNFAYLFMLSSLIMSIGLITFITIDEPAKISTNKKEDSFRSFIANSAKILKNDKKLQIQTAASLLGYSFLLAMPFVILQAKESISLNGWIVGSFITVQMIGGMIGNLFLWKSFGSHYVKMLMVAYSFMITAFVIVFFADNAWLYGLVFFIFGIGIDGFRNADMNLILEIAPEHKRPVYVAIQSTIVSFGLFFSIPGGFILKTFGYYTLYSVTLSLLGVGLYMTYILKRVIKTTA